MTRTVWHFEGLFKDEMMFVAAKGDVVKKRTALLQKFER